LKDVIRDADVAFLAYPEIEEFSKKMLTLLHECEQNKKMTDKFIREEPMEDFEETGT
jgi:hypothetical protein